jgi:hypothetical protein
MNCKSCNRQLSETEFAQKTANAVRFAGLVWYLTYLLGLITIMLVSLNWGFFLLLISITIYISMVDIKTSYIFEKTVKDEIRRETIGNIIKTEVINNVRRKK